MRVSTLRPVKEFLNKLDDPLRMHVQHVIDLLEQYGHTLSMPYAKPIGRGLWELRYTGRPHIRVIYGICRGSAVLVLGFKKQRSASKQRDMVLACKRLAEYCA
ncbi:MAG: type II toxin-antitoxin system RelE/ParE family toxin [Patescibacteria group bacterium]